MFWVLDTDPKVNLGVKGLKHKSHKVHLLSLTPLLCHTRLSTLTHCLCTLSVFSIVICVSLLLVGLTLPKFHYQKCILSAILSVSHREHQKWRREEDRQDVSVVV